MGCGNWTTDSFATYSASVRNSVVDTMGNTVGNYSTQDFFKSRSLDPLLDPKNVIRECCDNEEHPNTIPVILALDVTGSMGSAATEVAKQLNIIMTKLYEKVTDVEFLVMGIGDLGYDYFPIQASQFESDIRICEQMDKVYFEFGGGGNSYESYTAAWYFGSRHTKLDCWKRGKKGIIITMGDEQLNPYLPAKRLREVTGDTLQANIETGDLYKEASDKFDIYHINVEHNQFSSDPKIENSFKKYLDDAHYRDSNIDGIANTIVEIITNAATTATADAKNVSMVNENGEIAW